MIINTIIFSVTISKNQPESMLEETPTRKQTLNLGILHHH